MKDRPEIDQRVRVLGNTGLKGVTGRVGRVIGHYPDGIAFRVRLEDADRREFTCDPVNVEPAPVGEAIR